MRLLFVADGRSPIALNWMRFFVERGDEVHLATTFPAQPGLPLASVTFIPVAFSQAKGKPAPGGQGKRKAAGLWGAWAVGLRTRARQWLGPLTLPAAGRRLAALIAQVQPELVHAMRIPYEGMVAAAAYARLGKPRPPLLLSLWGNDFTLHAPSSPWMAALTRSALRSADALHSDCRRDVRLAHTWGFAASKEFVVLPGAGGIQLDVFAPPADAAERSHPLVVNPRGIRVYVRNDTFFRAIPLVLAQQPAARFACVGMAGERQAERWLDALDIRPAAELLPALERGEMAALFRRAQVTVSPAIHDGTPNTLLEALACGCFPVAGDIESLREWIMDGENGLLVDPGDPQALAQAILQALNDPALRAAAQEKNARLVRERAEYGAVMGQALAFYQKLASQP